MQTMTSQTELIHSTLLDPDLDDIVELFVQEIPVRIATLCTSAAEGNWAEVGRLAHQLKGAGGSYGFPQLTICAGSLEHAAKSNAGPHAIGARLNDLVDLSLRLRAPELYAV